MTHNEPAFQALASSTKEQCMGFLELLFIILIVGVIALIARLLYRVIRGAMTGGDTRTPEEILEDRYTRGEIDAHELNERRRQLRR